MSGTPTPNKILWLVTAVLLVLAGALTVAARTLKTHSADKTLPVPVSTAVGGQPSKAPAATPASESNPTEAKVFDASPLDKVKVDLTRPMVEWLSETTPDLHAFFIKNKENPYFGYTILRPSKNFDRERAVKRKEELFGLLEATDISDVSKGDLCLAMKVLLREHLSAAEKLRITGVEFNVSAKYNYNMALSILYEEVTNDSKTVPGDGLLQALIGAGWQVNQDEIDFAIKGRGGK